MECSERLVGLPREVVELLTPILIEFDETLGEYSFEDFETACKKLYATMTVQEKVVMRSFSKQERIMSETHHTFRVRQFN